MTGQAGHFTHVASKTLSGVVGFGFAVPTTHVRQRTFILGAVGVLAAMPRNAVNAHLVWRAQQEQLLHRLGELAPGGIHAEAVLVGQGPKDVLKEPRHVGRSPNRNSTGRQALVGIGDD